MALAACLSVPSLAQVAPAPSDLPQLQGVRRVVFLGDSITQAGEYVVDIECWLALRGQRVEVLNLGLGSETASDLTTAENAGHLGKYGFGRPFVSERIQRLLSATKPDLVFACYGMNDASSLPADASGDKRFAEAVTRLRETILGSGVRQVVVLTPPVREFGRDDRKGEVHEQGLTRYTEWLLSMKAKGWTVVDLHTPMRGALERKRAEDPGFGFTKDGVHPGREGHWVMARCVIGQFFGARVDDIANAEGLFPARGEEIRALIQRRMKVLSEAWMSRIGHKRPGVPGGPGVAPGRPVEEAESEAAGITAAITKEILDLRAGVP